MADEQEKKQEAPEGAVEAADGEEKSRTRLFSKTGLVIFAAVILIQAVAFGLLFFMGGEEAADAQGTGSESGDGMADEELMGEEVDEATLAGLKPYILDLDEVTIYPQSTQINAPHRITAEIHIIISEQLGEILIGEGKEATAVKVVRLNLRQVLKQMLEEYGVRIVDGSVREAFQHEAKTRLNNVQIEGDRELLKILRLLRGHVRQVLVDRLEQSSF